VRTNRGCRQDREVEAANEYRMVDVGLGAGLGCLLVKRVGQADDLLRRHMIAWRMKFGITAP
jgi:hypothetical protein